MTCGSFEPVAQTAMEVHQKFFSRARSPVQSQKAPADSPGARIPLWNDHAGRTLVADNSAIRIGYGAGMSSNVTDGFASEGGTGMLRPTGIVIGPGNYGLRSRGLLRGEVEVRLTNLPDGWLAPFNSLNLAVRRHTSVMPDSWAARNAESVDHRVGHSATVFPASQLRPLAQLIQLPILALEDGQMRAPQLGELGFWRDTVPGDRLK